MSNAPPYGPEVDLRTHCDLPLDVEKLRDSTLTAVVDPEGFRAAVLLWCAAWHQVPAASLPDDDRILASYCGYARDLAGWELVKNSALRGFELCSDGRLYHWVLVEKAIQVINRKAQGRKAAVARAKKMGVKPPPPEVEVKAQMPEPEVPTVYIAPGPGRKRSSSAFDPLAIQFPGTDSEAWNMYMSYRRQIRKPYKAVSIRAAQKLLASHGDAQAQRAVVERTIAAGWMAVPPPKEIAARQEAASERSRKRATEWKSSGAPRCPSGKMGNHTWRSDAETLPAGVLQRRTCDNLMCDAVDELVEVQEKS